MWVLEFVFGYWKVTDEWYGCGIGLGLGKVFW